MSLGIVLVTRGEAVPTSVGELMDYLGFDPVTEGQNIEGATLVMDIPSKVTGIYYRLIQVNDERLSSPNLTIVFKDFGEFTQVQETIKTCLDELIFKLSIPVVTAESICSYIHKNLKVLVCTDAVAGFKDYIAQHRRQKFTLH